MMISKTIVQYKKAIIPLAALAVFFAVPAMAESGGGDGGHGPVITFLWMGAILFFCSARPVY